MSGTDTLAQRGVTNSAFSFLDLVRMTRIEAGRSSNPSMGVNDQETVKYVINRTQQELYFKFDWPGNIVDRDVLLIDGGQSITTTRWTSSLRTSPSCGSS